MPNRTGMSGYKRIDVDSLPKLKTYGIRRIAVAIGVFDGVHLGHQLLLNVLKKMAAKINAVPVVLTFFPHPREVLKPREPLLLLISQDKKIDLLHSFGIKAVVTFPFTKDFAMLPPEDFLENCLLTEDVELCGICVGEKWRFGTEGGGDIRTIANFAEKRGISFEAVPEHKIDGRIVSSTAVRHAVSGGLLGIAAKLLGRNHSLKGIVEYGENIAAKVLDCPTANISVTHGILPPNGVYAGYSIFDGKKYKAALSVGTAPSFRHKNQSKILIEAHLFDFSGELHGKELEVEFVIYLREERVFSSVEHLKEQISKDLKEIKHLLDMEKTE